MITFWGVLGRVGVGWGWLVITFWGVLGRVGWGVVSDNVLGCIGQSGGGVGDG